MVLKSQILNSDCVKKWRGEELADGKREVRPAGREDMLFFADVETK